MRRPVIEIDKLRYFQSDSMKSSSFMVQDKIILFNHVIAKIISFPVVYDDNIFT